MADLTFYTNPMSRGRIVRWMLEECGADYETKILEFGTTMKEPAYLAINPMGKVPALKHGDTVITETLAITLYLADVFSDEQLAPVVGDHERGTYYRWLTFLQHLEYAIMDRWFAVEEGEQRHRSIGYGDFDTALAVLHQALSEKDYLVADQFSAADLFCCGLLGWGYGRAKVLPANDSFQRYMQRMSARPAFARAAALDDALLTDAQP